MVAADRLGRRFGRRFGRFGGFPFPFQPDDFRLQFAEAKGKFLDAFLGLHRPRNQPDGQNNGDPQYDQDDDGYHFHKVSFLRAERLG